MTVYNRLYYLRQKERLDLYKSLVDELETNNIFEIDRILNTIKTKEAGWEECIPRQKPGPKNHKQLFKLKDRVFKKFDRRVYISFE